MRKARAKRAVARAKWAAIAAAAAMAGCTQATVSLPDGTSVSFTRFASEADLILSPDGLHYSSSPSAVAQQNALDLVGQALGVALRGGLQMQPQAMPARLRASEAGL